MINIGQYNTLTVSKSLPTGAVLDGGKFGNILLTRHSDSEHYRSGDQVTAFIYLDAEGELAATTLKPKAQVGEVASFQVSDCNQVGAFLDWGLPKELFVPFAEQVTTLKKGQQVLAKVYLDNRSRVTATTRLDRVIKDCSVGLKNTQAVDLIIAEKTTLGYKAIINHTFWGLLYESDITSPLKRGQSLQGFVKRLRPDGRVDLCLEKPGYSQQKIDTVAEDILTKLREHGGEMLLNDKSPPEVIKSVFGVSKKVFKKSLGALYKQRKISIEKNGIRLVK